MRHERLDEFFSWAEKHGSPQRCELTDNPAANIDFETDAAMARITYWASGHCDAEIIDFDSEETIYQKHWDELLPEYLERELADFFRTLSKPDRLR